MEDFLGRIRERWRRCQGRASEVTMASCNTAGCRRMKAGCSTIWAFLRRHLDNVLLVILILFMIIGCVMGVLLRDLKPRLTSHQVLYLQFPGELLMRMLRMLILPLIVSSLVAGLANLDIAASGKIGGRAVAYYVSTTFLAVILGIVLCVTIQPGTRGSKWELATSTREQGMVLAADKIMDLVRSCFPDNLITATFEQVDTTYTMYDCNSANPPQICNNTALINTIERANKTLYYTVKVVNKTGLNILGILVFCIAFGIVLGSMREQGKPLKDFFNCLSEVSMRLVKMVIWYSPIGICFLIAAKLVEMDDLEAMIIRLAFYMVTILVGLAIHGLIFLPTIYAIFTRKNPFRFILGIIQALVTAFATSSSSATLPVTLKCLEENNKLDKRVVSFVVPVGATINMDGTALYEAVACLFIAQLNGIDLSVGEIIITSFTATIASIGAAGVPSAGLITMIIVLNAVGLPDSDIAYILAVDWFLDRFRTTINVLGDCLGAGIVNHLVKDSLEAIDHSSVEANGKTPINGELNTGYTGDQEHADTHM